MQDDTKVEDLDVTNAEDVKGAGCGPEELVQSTTERHGISDPVGRVDAMSDTAGRKVRSLGFDRPTD